MKQAERIIMVVLALTLIGGGVWLYLSVQSKQQAVRDAVARGEYEIRDEEKEKSTLEVSVATSTDNRATPTQEEWRQYYPTLVPVIIGSTTVAASVADSLAERIKGLLDTPYLPDGVVKLFAFGAAGEHSIWMKDMNYSLDIIWVSEKGFIVHIEEGVSPETFPKSFSSPKPAFYVIEANTGFVEQNGVVVGDKVVIVPAE